MIDVTKARVIHNWTYERPLLACGIDPQARFVVTSSENRLLQRFFLPDGRLDVFPPAHDSWVQAIALAADGRTCVSGGGDGRLVWWDLTESITLVRTVDAHDGWIRSLSLSPDGRWLASGGYDHQVHLWDMATGARVRSWADHEMKVYAVQFFPDGERLATGDLQGTIVLRDRQAEAPIARFDGSSLHSYNEGQRVNFGGVRSLAVDQEMTHLAAGGLHKASNPLGAVHEPLALQFTVAHQTLLHSHTAEGIPGGSLWQLKYLPDGHLVGVCGGSTGGLLLFWKRGQDLAVHKFQLPSLARGMDATADSSLVATTHHDGHLRISRLVEP